MNLNTEKLAEYLYNNHVSGYLSKGSYSGFAWPEWKGLDGTIKTSWYIKAENILSGKL